MSPERPLRALVTAGGTREPIDDVRVVTNLSRGRFGAALAHTLAARGVEVTLLGSAELLRPPHGIDPRIRCVPFATYADLARELEVLIGGTPPDLLLMAAAVSDYSPIRAEGKIRSDADELVVRMRRNPKLLAGLRERCGVGTFLVGFKLMSGVSHAELVATAHRQVRQERLNLTVANDLATFTEERHPVVLVTPEGGALPVTGAREEVAGRVVEFLLRRARVRWCRCQPDPTLAAPPDTGADRAARLLAFAQDAGVLPGTDGNVSARADGDGLWTTPRQVAKATVRPADLVRVAADPDTRRVRWHGARKPSIDSAVHAWLYRRLPRIAAFLHFHDALVVEDAATGFPYPCGTLEEAEEVHRALARAAAARRWAGGPFAVRLTDHGYLLGLEADGPDRIAREWAAARSAHAEHLATLHEATGLRLEPAPVFVSTRVAGVFARHPVERWGTTFLLPSQRGQGAGERILALLEARGETMAAHDGCGVLAYYHERGWRTVQRRAPVTVLEAPTRRDDLQPAVSVCLYEPMRRWVLIGRRRTEPWLGHWTFPGGRAGAGETLASAAARELAEETGLDLPDPQPVARQLVHLGTDAGRNAWAVTCFVHLVLDTPSPRASSEFEAEWLPLTEALARHPLAPGTRRVLASLPDLAVSGPPVLPI